MIVLQVLEEIIKGQCAEWRITHLLCIVDEDSGAIENRISTTILSRIDHNNINGVEATTAALDSHSHWRYGDGLRQLNPSSSLLC